MSDELLWRRLSAELDRLVADVPAGAGVCVRDLTTDRQIAIHADEVFPTASTIKITILAHLMERVEAGAVDLARRVEVDASMRVPGSGVLTYLDDDAVLTVRDVAVLMILVSDNTATNLCIDWATMDGTNAMLRRLGLAKTALRRKMQDAAAMQRGDENVAAPAELVRLLCALYRQDGLSPFVCGETLRILKKHKRGHIREGLPEGVPVANKTGGMPRVCNDAGIVYLPRRPYALAVMTNFGPEDRHVQPQFIADVSRTVYEYLATIDATGPYGQGIPAELLR